MPQSTQWGHLITSRTRIQLSHQGLRISSATVLLSALRVKSIFIYDFITNARLFKYIENLISKNWKFSDKKLRYFSYEGESISNQPNLFPVEIHLFFVDVIAF